MTTMMKISLDNAFEARALPLLFDQLTSWLGRWSEHVRVDENQLHTVCAVRNDSQSFDKAMETRPRRDFLQIGIEF